MIDGTDTIILNILQSNARTSNAEIARQVGLAPSAVFERIRKLEERGVIEGYAARVNPKAVGLPLLAFVFVRADEKPGADRTAAKVAEFPEVLEVHHVAGEDCFLAKVRAADTEALGRLLRDKLGRISTITSTRTTIVLGSLKERLELPIESPAAEAAEEPVRVERIRRAAPAPSTARVVAAFAAVYVLWGSTYLGIRFSIETLPPFFTQGVRFLTAGVVLYLWARMSGAAAPAAREWRAGALTGALLFLGGTGAVVWAERAIPSGVAALVVATEPISFVLLEAMRRRRRPSRFVVLGLALGAAGLAILVGPGKLWGSGRFDLAASAVLVAGTFCWAAGSLYSRGSWMPASPILATALTLVGGGVCLALVGLASGELSHFDPAAVSSRSVLATVYLFVFGSIVGFSAYLWLLRVSTPSRVSTYAYVNPIVAVLLGWALAGEALTARVLLAAVVIIGAVALIIRHGGEEAPAAARLEPELAGVEEESIHA